MSLLKPALMLAILSTSLLCREARATDPPPRVGADKAAVAKPAKARAAKRKPASAPRAAPARRAVRQLGDGMPARAAPSALAAPALPAVPQPAVPQPIASPQATDSQYKGGVGNALIGPNGRVCSDNGVTVQCF